MVRLDVLPVMSVIRVILYLEGLLLHNTFIIWSGKAGSIRRQKTDRQTDRQTDSIQH